MRKQVETRSCPNLSLRMKGLPQQLPEADLTNAEKLSVKPSILRIFFLTFVVVKNVDGRDSPAATQHFQRLQMQKTGKYQKYIIL